MRPILTSLICQHQCGFYTIDGTTTGDIKSGYRRITHQSHVIFYRSHNKDVFIVRVLHKAMDIGKLFLQYIIQQERKPKIRETAEYKLCRNDSRNGSGLGQRIRYYG